MDLENGSPSPAPEPQRGQKRKSSSNCETPAKSKLPKYEPVPVVLQAKIIYIPNDAKYKVLDRVALTRIPPKEGAYEVGDLIWGKMVGYPWWPCMISVDPETGNYAKITGNSCKADRVYHVQYFGPEPYRGWTTIGMVMPFEGIESFYQRVNDEIGDLPKKKAAKVLDKYAVKPSIKKKWFESISEAEEALKFDQLERVKKFTFHYLVKENVTEAKSRKSTSSVSKLESGDQSKAVSTPNSSSSSKNGAKKLNGAGGKRSSMGQKKANTSREDVYDFDEDSDDGLDNSETLSGLLFRKRAPKGDFQVFLRKQYDQASKENPNQSKSEIIDILKKRWDDMTEEDRGLFFEPKAIYEDESNMLVSKRAKFDSDYDDSNSDYDYKSDDGSAKDANEDGENLVNSAGGDSNNVKSKRKSRRSEKLFDKIKNQESPSNISAPSESGGDSGGGGGGGGGSVGSKRKSASAAAATKKKSISSSEMITPAKPQTNNKKSASASSRKVANSTVINNNDSVKSDKSKKGSGKETEPKKKLVFEDPSDGSSSSSDTASVNDVESGERVSKKSPVDQFCYICSDEPTEGNELVSCKGECLRLFHKLCLADIAEIDDDFRCDECKANKHKCFACNNPDDLDTKKCEDVKCGRFYHLNCIEEHYPIKVNESANTFLCPLHACHTCHLETLNDRENRANKKKLVRCIYCPTAYHAKDFCTAAGTVRVSKNYVICPDHVSKNISKNKDRHINVNYCFCCLSGGQLICCESCPAAFHEECLEYTFDHDKSFYCGSCTLRKQLYYGDIVWVKLGHYRWWPGRVCHPNTVPENVLALKHNIGDFPVYFFGSHDYYWVNKGRAYLFVEGDHQAASANVGNKSGNSKSLQAAFNNALNEAKEAFEEWNLTRKQIAIQTIANKPPPYQQIYSNRYIAPKKEKSNQVQICECKEESPCIDETCLNRMIHVECDPKQCPVGDKCKNQRFRKCEYVKCKPFKTGSAGWGLMAAEDIKEGQFIIEYCGEVIDEKECDKRLAKIASNQSNFYFLNLDKDLFIDAGPKGNLARFMNHSCQPNCVTQKWDVNNLTRVGLFALRDIPIGTELTFNYNLDCRGNERIECKCGSANCSGFIGDRVKNDDAKNKRIVNGGGGGGSKQKKGKQRKSKQSFPSSSKSSSHEDACFKCGEMGRLIMCDEEGCPKSYHLSCINLSFIPKDEWICPRHRCMICKKPVTAFCSFCPTSYCTEHTENNLQQLPDDQFLCKNHRSDNPEEMAESEENGGAVGDEED